MDNLTSLYDYLRAAPRTLFCAGPMSRLCIDAAAEVSSRFSIPLALIASRRQIDSADCGGGYVENFTTENFAAYVAGKNAPYLLIARDHGGPGQGPAGANADPATAMAEAKRSFEVDIDAGFQMIHVDASIPLAGETLSLDTVLERSFELYAHCFAFAQRQGRQIVFEVGTEEQKGDLEDLEQFEYLLSRICGFCDREHLPRPLFVVAQTGTRVMETRNIGLFGTLPEKDFGPLVAQVEMLAARCASYGVLLKEHNADYLPAAALVLRPVSGIRGANIAPELGVAETRALLAVLAAGRFDAEINEFIALSRASGKWQKWMLPETAATEYDQAVISGHYVFAHPSVRAIREKAAAWLAGRGMALDDLLKNAVHERLLCYLRLFRMIGEN